MLCTLMTFYRSTEQSKYRPDLDINIIEMSRNTESRTVTAQMLRVRAFLLVTAVLTGYCEAAFQWSCSSPDVFQSGALYVPDIPASLNGIGTIELTAASVIYLYPVPSLNCQGRVTGVEYCYQKIDLSDPAAISSEIIFTVLIMSRVDSQGHVQFRVDRDIPIPTPTSTPPQQCSAMICCDSYTFTNEQFDLPQGEFSLGILTPSSGHQIVAFHASQAEYRAPGYLVNGAGFDLDTNPTITVGTQQSTSLRVLQLVVRGSLDALTTDSDPANYTNTTNSPSTLGPQNNAAPIAVGVVVGVLVAVALVVVIVVMVVMYYRKHQTKDLEPKQKEPSDGRNLMESQQIDTLIPVCEDIPSHHYEEIVTMDITRNTVEVPVYETIVDNSKFGTSSQNPAYGLLQKETTES